MIPLSRATFSACPSSAKNLVSSLTTSPDTSLRRVGRWLSTKLPMSVASCESLPDCCANPQWHLPCVLDSAPVGIQAHSPGWARVAHRVHLHCVLRSQREVLVFWRAPLRSSLGTLTGAAFCTLAWRLWPSPPVRQRTQPQCFPCDQECVHSKPYLL